MEILSRSQETAPSPRMNLEALGNLVEKIDQNRENRLSAEFDFQVSTGVIRRMNRTARQ